MPRQRHRAAFTLIELLVVIAIIAILASLLVPVVTEAMEDGRRTQVMANGRSIFQALFAESADGRNLLPSSTGPNGFASSTEYWKWAVSNGVLDVTFDFFAAPGIAPCHGLDPDAFRPENNAWCVVADAAAGARNSMPLLFTRNLGITDLTQTPSEHLTAMPPFGKEAVIVVSVGASARVLEANELDARFNPVAAENVVLRPAP